MYNLITYKYLKLSIQDKHCMLKNKFPNPFQLYHFHNYKVKLEILFRKNVQVFDILLMMLPLFYNTGNVKVKTSSLECTSDL